jgi:hypothetical protein
MLSFSESARANASGYNDKRAWRDEDYGGPKKKLIHHGLSLVIHLARIGGDGRGHESEDSRWVCFHSYGRNDGVLFIPVWEAQGAIQFVENIIESERRRTSDKLQSGFYLQRVQICSRTATPDVSASRWNL